MHKQTDKQTHTHTHTQTSDTCIPNELSLLTLSFRMGRVICLFSFVLLPPLPSPLLPYYFCWFYEFECRTCTALTNNRGTDEVNNNRPAVRSIRYAFHCSGSTALVLLLLLLPFTLSINYLAVIYICLVQQQWALWSWTLIECVCESVPTVRFSDDGLCRQTM